MSDMQSIREYLENIRKQDAKHKPTFGSVWKYLDSKARKTGIPINGQMELTPLCNFDCKMCYTHLTKEQMGKRKLLTVKQWKQLIHEAWEAGMLAVNLTGGECLTYPGFEEIYLYLHSLGCEARVLSNGALLDEKWIRFFAEHKPSLLQITLYGGDEKTYEQVTGQRKFATVTENIRKAAEAKLPVELVITPSKYLGEGVFDTLRTAEELKVPYSVNSWLMDPKEETGRAHLEHDLGVEDYKRIYVFRNELRGIETREIESGMLPPAGGTCHKCESRGLTCGAGLSCFTIEWDGRMLACNSLRENEGWPLEEGFLTVWKRLYQISAEWIRIPECIDCPYGSVCTNCVVQKERYAERGKQPVALCEEVRYLVQSGVRHIAACDNDN